MTKATKETVAERYKRLLKEPCDCPTETDLKPTDVLIITNRLKYHYGDLLPPYTMNHVFLCDCVPDGVVDEDMVIRCTKRKLDLIEKLKPKLVICAGNDVYRSLETAMGYTAPTRTDVNLLPTMHNGHDFWMLPIPHWTIKIFLKKHRNLINKAMKAPPTVLTGNLEGVEFILDDAYLQGAFDYLAKQELVALDLETNGLRPYRDGAKILSGSLSGGDKTFVMPLFHSQTPSTITGQKVLDNIYALSKQVPMVFHNAVFELEWLAYFTDHKFLYTTTYHDTQAQAYLSSKLNHKGLNDCVRRAFGFDLKSISDLDRKTLDSAPIEKVLSYNALDSKYTLLLHYVQKEIIARLNLDAAYKIQTERIPAVVLMQLLGLEVDQEFVKEQLLAPQEELARLYTEFNSYSEVLAYIEDDRILKSAKKTKKKVEVVGECNPLSPKVVTKLFKDYLNLPGEIETVDESFLATIDHPIAVTLGKLRKANKFISTYVLPLDMNNTDDKKRVVYPNGQIHTNFNTMNCLTGRLSSSSPNCQNFPSHGGMKYLRNVIKAPEGYTMVAIDYGQLESRLIASFANDTAIIKALFEGHDEHMVWTKMLIDLMPGQFVEDATDIKQVKAFRSTLKSQAVFPLFYGAGRKSCGERLGLTDKQLPLIDEFFDAFWKLHPAVPPWQKYLQAMYNKQGYSTSPFGRKFWAPLQWTEIINYKVQGSGSDIVVAAMSKLAKMAIEYDILDLCPRINLHDDLSFYIRNELVEELLPIILGVMLDVSEYKWLKVPLTVEVSLGRSWGNLEELGTWSSDTWNGAL